MSAVSGKNVGDGKQQRKARGANKNIKLDEIWVGPRMREVSPAMVNGLVVSLRDAGLKTPLSIRASSDRTKTDSRPWILVAGAHRLKAAKHLCWKTIRCEIFRGTEIEARVWEIRENLDRAELTVLEHADHIAELLKATSQGEVLAQVAPKPLGGRPEGGARAGARALGRDRTEVTRALKIASISAASKAAIKAAKLDDQQALLLKVAKEPSERAQLAMVTQIARRRSRERTGAKHTNEGDIQEKRRTVWQALVALTADGLGKRRQRFVRLALDIGGPDLIRFAIAIRDWQPPASENRTRGAGRGKFGRNDGPRFFEIT